MPNLFQSYNEAQINYILHITKASKKEIINTIRLSQVSIGEIITYLKKRKLQAG